jgi:hypothetical protein
MISPGATVTVETSRFSDPAQSVTITGTVSAARGNEGGDDRWNVAALCSNADSSGNPILPPHYKCD